jgi:hypothetical protein
VEPEFRVDDSTVTFLDKLARGFYESVYAIPPDIDRLVKGIESVEFVFGGNPDNSPSANIQQWGGPITCIIKKVS